MALLAALWIVTAAFSLLHRVQTGQTDFSVFYRTAHAIQGGVAPGFYEQLDPPTGLRYCISPSGTMLFAYMPFLSIRGAAIVWAVLNIALLILSAWCLHRIFSRLDRQRRLYRRTWLWAVFVLLILSGDALQVGQFSILFVACWLVYLAVDSGLLAACMLVLPAAIKIYPALLWAAPVALRDWRRTAWLIPAVVVVAILLPLALYGSHLPGMWTGFLQTTLLGGESSRMLDMINPYLPSNQSLDVTLLRYLADIPAFSDDHPGFPSLGLDEALVMRLIMLLKLAILTVTSLAAWRLGRRARLQPRWTALMMMALWTAALFLLMPETKARYAVYLFPAWLPLLAMTAAARHRRWHYAGCCVLLALGLASVMQLVPDAMRLYGLSCFASLAIWLALAKAALSQTPVPAGHAG